MFLKLQGKKCVIVGGGAIGEGKAMGLLHSGARVMVVAPRVSQKLQDLAVAGAITVVKRRFRSSDLRGTFLAIAATDSAEQNHEVSRQCRRRGVLCNAVDDPEYCDFFYPAVVRRGALQIAISTDGRSPALAKRLRAELEKQFGPEYGAWVEEVGEQRRRILSQKLPAVEQSVLLQKSVGRKAFKAFIENASRAVRRR